MDARSPETISPTGQDVSLADGRKIAVRPITLGQLPRFVKAIRPAFGALVALAPVTSSPGDAGGQGADPSPEGEAAASEAGVGAFVDLLADHGQAVSEAIAICTGMTLKEAEALDLEEAFAVTRALWAVNQDFFTRRVLPLLRQ